ncbi:MAG: hypothetical protein SO287_09235 [Parabacteroides sp.]|nr:hypothetical protein [Parabacteroides sp.]MDY4757749.1 hypothetical protein [Parabacteroides sp.]
MRRLGLCVAVALMMGATTSFAQEGRDANQKSFERLSKYLRLTEAQAPEVAEINAYFEGQLGQPLSAEALSQSDRAEEVQKALLCNLKLMKRTLTKEQYGKYVALINVTRANQPKAISSPDLEAYLAEK